MNTRRAVSVLLSLSAFGFEIGAAVPAYAQAAPSGIPCSALTDAVVANTGQIFSDASSKVTGNVQAATTILNNGGVIIGTETQNSPAALPVVPPPAGATNLGNFGLGSGQTRTLAAGNYVASSFTLNSNSTLVISGGPVFIWVTGALTLSGAENAGGAAKSLQFLVTDSQDVNVNSSAGTLTGSVYAPEARVNVNRSVVGTIVGSTVTLNSGSAVQFDSGSACPVVKVTKVVVGDFQTCALLSTDQVDCWGEDDGQGDLGTGTTGRETCTTSDIPCRTTPAPLLGAAGITDVSLGCVALSNGTVDCWGADSAGDLGNGTMNPPTFSPPGPVTGITNAVAVTSSNGEAFFCALLADGTAKCWGENFAGELGNGTTVDSTVPVVVSGLHDAISISAGGQHACAVLSNGTVQCWGGGDLGNGTSNESPVPVTVVGLSDAVAVAVGTSAICALRSGGGVDCWGGGGFGNFGQVGDGTTTERLTPVPVVGITNAVSVSAGQATTCAVLANGTVQCWGLNDGQLGIGTATGPDVCGASPCSTVPVTVLNVNDAIGVSVGDVSTCVLLSTGGVDCWGDDEFGELGNGVNTSGVLINSGPSSNVPVAVDF